MRPMKLIDASLFQQLMLLRAHSSKAPQHVAAQSPPPGEKGEPVPVIEEVAPAAPEGEEDKTSVNALIESLPKNYRRRARLLLASPSIKFEENTFRIIYPSQGGEEEHGSHLMGEYV